MSAPDRAANLADAAENAWQDERKPGLTRAESAALLAAKRYAQVDDALRSHTGSRSGPEYEALLAEWRAARDDVLAAGRTPSGNQP